MQQIITRDEAVANNLMFYFSGVPCPEGHVSERYVSNRGCFECIVTRSRGRAADLRSNHPEKRLWESAKRSAKRRGLEFSIALEDIFIPSCCPCCKKEFALPAHEPRTVHEVEWLSPSIDRFHNHVGYTKENIRIICFRCNELKRDATADELRVIVAWMDAQ